MPRVHFANVLHNRLANKVQLKRSGVLQVTALPRKALVDQFGEERATYILRAVSGYSDEPVQARGPPGQPHHCDRGGHMRRLVNLHFLDTACLHALPHVLRMEGILTYTEGPCCSSIIL